MAGSRKGERRGGARKNYKRKKLDFTPPAPRKRGHQPGVPSRAAEERAAMIQKLITGRDPATLPKETLLEAMRYWLELARDYRDLAKVNRMTDPPTDQAQRAEFELLIATFEERSDKYYLMATDVAFKVAPFIHPKLAAIKMMGEDDPNKQGDPLADILREIDAEARRPMIDVTPNPSSERMN